MQHTAHGRGYELSRKNTQNTAFRPAGHISSRHSLSIRSHSPQKGENRIQDWRISISEQGLQGERKSAVTATPVSVEGAQHGISDSQSVHDQHQGGNDMYHIQELGHDPW